jgi:tRNA pseudouridine55 synthase
VLAVGRATRLVQFLSGDEKEYEAAVRFGVATDTYDAESLPAAGAVPPADPPVTMGTLLLEPILQEFRGTYWQMPPPYSAKKVAGVAAYKRARRKERVDLKPVEVTVRTLELLSYSDGLAWLRVVCSSGFYVRSLAHDLGQRVGAGAHLEALRRTRAGQYGLEQATALDVVEREGEAAVRRLVAMDRMLSSLPQAILSPEGLRRVTHGNAVGPACVVTGHVPPPGRHVRLLDEAGSLVAVAESGPGELLRPVVVVV